MSCACHTALCRPCFQRVLLTLRIQKWFIAFSLCVCCRTELFLYNWQWDRAAFWPRSCQCVCLTGVLQSNLLLHCCQSDSKWRVLLALCWTSWSLLQAFCWLKWAPEQALTSFPWEENEFFPLVTNNVMLPYQPSLQKGFFLLVKNNSFAFIYPNKLHPHTLITRQQFCYLHWEYVVPVPLTLNLLRWSLWVTTFFWGWKRMMCTLGAKRQPSTTKPLRLTEMHIVVVCTWKRAGAKCCVFVWNLWNSECQKHHNITVGTTILGCTDASGLEHLSHSYLVVWLYDRCVMLVVHSLSLHITEL